MGREESVVEGGCHFPCGCQLCAKGAELEPRLVPRMAADERNVSVISGDQPSPYGTHVCAADQEQVCVASTI